jgi:hypothetical protein
MFVLRLDVAAVRWSPCLLHYLLNVDLGSAFLTALHHAHAVA